MSPEDQPGGQVGAAEQRCSPAEHLPEGIGENRDCTGQRALRCAGPPGQNPHKNQEDACHEEEPHGVSQLLLFIGFLVQALRLGRFFRDPALHAFPGMSGGGLGTGLQGVRGTAAAAVHAAHALLFALFCHPWLLSSDEGPVILQRDGWNVTELQVESGASCRCGRTRIRFRKKTESHGVRCDSSGGVVSSDWGTRMSSIGTPSRSLRAYRLSVLGSVRPFCHL